jgi:hypothetical protein
MIIQGTTPVLGNTIFLKLTFESAQLCPTFPSQDRTGATSEWS